MPSCLPHVKVDGWECERDGVRQERIGEMTNRRESGRERRMLRPYRRSVKRFMTRRRRRVIKIKRRRRSIAIRRRRVIAIKRRKKVTVIKRRRKKKRRKNIVIKSTGRRRRSTLRIRRRRSTNALFVGIALFKMILKCSKCNNVYRSCNAEKHAKHCKNAPAQCCDCGASLSLEEIPNHTDCPNALKSKVPPLYNPKAVCFSRCGLICRKYLTRISATFFLLTVLHSKTKIASSHPFSTNLYWWTAYPERRKGL